MVLASAVARPPAHRLALLSLSLSLSTATVDEAFLAGNAHYARGELDEAREAYNDCLRAEPDRTDCAINLASVLVDLGPQHEALAEALYRRVLAAEDKHAADAAYNLGLLLQDRKGDDATREAAIMYQRATASDPRRWDAWANMATALSELKFNLRAVEPFQRAILILEETQQAAPHQAVEGTDEYLGQLYYGLGMALSALSDDECTELAAAPDTLLIGLDAEGGASAVPGGAARVCRENALNALRTSATLQPDEPQAEHMLQALLSEGGDGDDGSLSRASPQFVRKLFDDFSDTFDTQLEALKYRVPQMVAEVVGALVTMRGEPYASAFDAGCGTGLAGPLLRPHVSGALVGVDLSEKMLERAATLRQGDAPTSPRVYDKLFAADLLTLQRRDVLPGGGGDVGVDLMTAADVLVYFGELRELLGAFAALSALGGDLVFSCERATADEAPQGWRLRPSGRFAHTKAYVVASAADAGYSLVGYREIVPRYENGEPVPGQLFTFRRGGP